MGEGNLENPARTDQVLRWVFAALSSILIGIAIAFLGLDREPGFFAIVAALVLAVVTVILLRLLPSRAPLKRWMLIGCLFVSIALLVAVPFLNGAVANASMIASGIILLVALLIIEDPERRLRTLAETCRAPVPRPGSTPNHHPTLRRGEPNIKRWCPYEKKVRISAWWPMKRCPYRSHSRRALAIVARERSTECRRAGEAIRRNAHRWPPIFPGSTTVAWPMRTASCHD